MVFSLTTHRFKSLIVLKSIPLCQPKSFLDIISSNSHINPRKQALSVAFRHKEMTVWWGHAVCPSLAWLGYTQTCGPARQVQNHAARSGADHVSVMQLLGEGGLQPLYWPCNNPEAVLYFYHLRHRQWKKVMGEGTWKNYKLLVSLRGRFGDDGSLKRHK